MTTSIKKIFFQIICFFGRLNYSHNVPVLLYHSIATDSSNMSVSPENFEKQLSDLRDNGYTSITLSELHSFFNRQSFPSKKVMITFDDGFLDNFEVAMPLLKKYGFGAVFFITGKFIGATADFCSNPLDRAKKMMSCENLQELNDNNFEIANHFFSHTTLIDMADEQINQEYLKNLEILKTIIPNNQNANYVAFPKNKKGDISKLLKSFGVLLGFGGRPGVVNKNSHQYDLPRIQIFDTDSNIKFMAKLNQDYYFLADLVYKIKLLLRSPWFYALLFLILSRFLFLILGLLGFPADAALIGDWWTVYGGDEVNYFATAKYLIMGQFIPGGEMMGFPLFFIPFIWLLNPATFIDVFPVMVFINGVVLHSIALIFIYFLAQEILGSKLKAYLVTVVFNIYPYLFYFLFKIGLASNEIIDQFINSRFRQLMFWHVGSDPLATVLIMTSLLLMVLMIKNKISSASLAALMGFFSAWAVVARLQNLVILPVFFLTLLILRKIKLLTYFTVFGAPLILLQAYANWASRGSVFKTTYDINTGSGGNIPMFDPIYIMRIFTYPMDYGVILLVPIIVIIILMFMGFYQAIKTHKAVGLFLLSYVVVNLLFISFLEPTFRNPRYFLPIMPVVLIVLYFPLDQLIKKITLYVKSK